MRLLAAAALLGLAWLPASAQTLSGTFNCNSCTLTSPTVSGNLVLGPQATAGNITMGQTLTLSNGVNTSATFAYQTNGLVLSGQGYFFNFTGNNGGSLISNSGTGSGLFLISSVSSATAPLYTFVGDTTTGLGRQAAGAVSITSAGVEAARFAGSGVTSLFNLTTGTNADVLCITAGGQVVIQAAGSCTISSMRFKRDIKPLHEDALATIAKLEPVAFNMKEDEAHPNADHNYGMRQIGLTAENVAAVDPRMALYEPDGVTPKSYRTEAVIATLVAAVNELNACRLRIYGNCWVH